MKLKEYLKVNKYFTGKVKKVFARDVFVSFPSLMSCAKGFGKLVPQSFNICFLKKKIAYKKWVRQSLGVCYEHASSLLLGLNKKDKYVAANCGYHVDANFDHAWNEFHYADKWYVYDCQDDSIYDKEEYYKTVEPKTIIETYTLEEILNRYDCFKNTGEKFDTIEVPDKFEMGNNVNYKDENGHTIMTKDGCYKGAKIKVAKNGEVLSACVEGHEIC